MAPLPLLSATTTITATRLPTAPASQPVSRPAGHRAQQPASTAVAPGSNSGTPSRKAQRKALSAAAVLTPAAVVPSRHDACDDAPAPNPLPALCSHDEEEQVQQPGPCSSSAATAVTAPAPLAAAASSAAPFAPSSAASVADCHSVASTSWGRRCRDQNSVTIKPQTIVKDAAGAIDKILGRGVTALVTALCPDAGAARAGPHAHASLNQAVKSIAVARQYVKDAAAAAEVTFLPFHRFDGRERPDPSRFAFLVFKSACGLAEELKTTDQTDLNVSRSSDVNKMANAIISVVLARGQAVMKAAGGEAIFVAMSAVVNARHRLIQKHSFDLHLAAAWITEDTVSTLGRESKFLRFNILKTETNGPKSDVRPTLPSEAYC